MKHNNIIPNGHFHKDWQLRVKTWFDQPGKKKSRRLKRKSKAALIAPRPASGPLRPVVHCQTQKYSSKIRAGRGFTLQELKEAGISAKQARTIGIAVDSRRTNKSAESLRANVQRLKAYKAKLVVFPRGRNTKPKAGDSSVEETSAAQQVSGAVFPVKNSKKSVVANLTEELKEFNAFKTLRIARSDARLVGLRKKRATEKKDA